MLDNRSNSANKPAVPPNRLFDFVDPLSPTGRRAAQINATEQFQQLVQSYGVREANRIWKEAAKAIPLKRGRPPGARTSKDGFDTWDALQCLLTCANFPQHADLSRWQVIRMVAEYLVDTDFASVAQKVAPPSKPRVGSVEGVSAADAKRRKTRIEATHKRLEREQAAIDSRREFEFAINGIVYGDGPRSVSSFMSPEERAARLTEVRATTEQAYPALPQAVRSSSNRRTRKSPI